MSEDVVGGKVTPRTLWRIRCFFAFICGLPMNFLGERRFAKIKSANKVNCPVTSNFQVNLSLTDQLPEIDQTSLKKLNKIENGIENYSVNSPKVKHSIYILYKLYLFCCMRVLHIKQMFPMRISKISSYLHTRIFYKLITRSVIV